MFLYFCHQNIIKYKSNHHQKQMGSEELKRLRKHLTKEDKQALAVQFGVSYGHIQNILSRPRNKRHDRILVVAAKMVEEEMDKINKVNEFVKTL